MEGGRPGEGSDGEDDDEVIVVVEEEEEDEEDQPSEAPEAGKRVLEAAAGGGPAKRARTDDAERCEAREQGIEIDDEVSEVDEQVQPADDVSLPPEETAVARQRDTVPSLAKDETQLRDAYTRDHGPVTREWEVLVCAELWGGYMQASSLVNIATLQSENTALHYDAAEHIKSIDSYGRVKAWVDFYDKSDAMRWCVAPMLVRQLGHAISDKDLRIVCAYRQARIVSQGLRPTTPELMLDIRKSLSQGATIMSVADSFKIPPRVIARLLLDSVQLTKKHWDNPLEYLPMDAAELLQTCKIVDTASCEEAIWECREKLSMLERAVAKWCVDQKLKVITRSSLPRRETPRPSLLVSPCTLNGKPVSWFEVCPFYGLRSSAVEEITHKRIQGMTEKYGPGCCLMPYQMDPYFAHDWADVLVLNLESLDSRFAKVLHEVMDRPIFEVRSIRNFDAKLGEWLDTHAPVDNAADGSCFPSENPAAPQAGPTGGGAVAPAAASPAAPPAQAQQQQPAAAGTPAGAAGAPGAAAAAPKTVPQRKGGRRAARNFSYGRDYGSM